MGAGNPLTVLRYRPECLGTGPTGISILHRSQIFSQHHIVGPSKYPPAEPGALVLEPLEAAYPCRSSQASLHSVNASPSAVPPQLGKLR
jgi:hypothetical protein